MNLLSNRLDQRGKICLLRRVLIIFNELRMQNFFTRSRLLQDYYRLTTTRVDDLGWFNNRRELMWRRWGLPSKTRVASWRSSQGTPLIWISSSCPLLSLDHYSITVLRRRTSLAILQNQALWGESRRPQYLQRWGWARQSAVTTASR